MLNCPCLPKEPRKEMWVWISMALRWNMVWMHRWSNWSKMHAQKKYTAVEITNFPSCKENLLLWKKDYRYLSSSGHLAFGFEGAWGSHTEEEEGIAEACQRAVSISYGLKHFCTDFSSSSCKQDDGFASSSEVPVFTLVL